MKKVLIIITAFFYILNGFSQPQTHSTPFADFHIHTSFKHNYKDLKDIDDIYNHRNDLVYLRSKYGKVNWQSFVKKPKALRNGKVSTVKNYNQSDFASLINSGGSIFCTSLYPYEKQFALSGFNRFISNNFVSGIPTKRLKKIGSEDSYPMKEFLAEYAFLQAQEIIDPYGSGFRIELARNKEDLIRILSSDNTSAQVISVEGAQVLYGPYSGARVRVKQGTCDAVCQSEIFGSIQTLRNLPHKVFFITLAHFTDNRVSGFAKTLDRPGILRSLLKQLSKSSKIRSKFFTKFGEGIHGEFDFGRFDDCDCKSLVLDNVNPPKVVDIKNVALPYTHNSGPIINGIGREVMEALLKPDSAGSKRILLDVKHFDIQARFEYYQLVKDLELKYRVKIPIIASHVAISGERLPIAMATGLNPLFDKYQEVENPLLFYEKQITKYNADWLCRTKNLLPADREKLFMDTRSVPGQFNPFMGNINTATVGWFYPWSINICDEEIKIIYDGDGIIGLNFDERILGGKMLNYSTEYAEFIESKYYSLQNDRYIFQSTPVTGYNFKEYYKCEPILRNLLYVVLKSGRVDTTAWDKVAIGSDFDGLIDPIDLSPTALQMPAFHLKLITYLEIFWQLHKMDDMFEGKDLFFNGTMSYTNAINKFFYENGRKFIMDNF